MERKILERLEASRARFAQRARERFEELSDRRILEPERVVEEKSRRLTDLRAERESVVEARDLAIERAESELRQLDRTIGRIEAELVEDRRLVASFSALEGDLRVITGRITLPDGRPAAGVSLTLTDERGSEAGGLSQATTDDAGVFSFQLEPSDFERFFGGASNFALVATGGPEEVNHRVVRPLGALSQRFQLIDVRIPRESPEPGSGSGMGLDRVRGVGPVFAARLQDQGVTTVAELTAMSAEGLAAALGTSEGRAARILQEAESRFQQAG